MPLRINNNIPAINAQRILRITGTDLSKRIERLSSGLRVNRAADDAAGLSVSEGLRSEISGFAQGMRNSEQAVNLVQTAEGALSEINAILIRMRELAVQSASSTVNDENRTSINAEYNQLLSEIDRIASVTSYNESSLLTGYGNAVSQSTAVSSALVSSTTGLTSVQVSSAAANTYTFIDSTGDGEITLGNGTVSQTIAVGPKLDVDGTGLVVATGSSVVANFDRLGLQFTLTGFRDTVGGTPSSDGYRDGDLSNSALLIEAGAGGSFQIGPDDKSIHRLEASISDMRSTGAALNMGGTSLSSSISSRSAISSIDLAINKVTQTRGDLGAIQTRLQFNIRANGVMMENDLASDSTIRDADIAAEVSAFSRAQVLSQSGLAVFAQANIQAASVLSLL